MLVVLNNFIKNLFITKSSYSIVISLFSTMCKMNYNNGNVPIITTEAEGYQRCHKAINELGGRWNRENGHHETWQHGTR